MNGSPSISPRGSAFFANPTPLSRPPIGISDVTAEKQERYERLRIEFDEIDENHDQIVSYDEVKKFLSRKAGTEFDDQLCQELFSSMDKDRDARVTVEEFIWSYVQAEELIQTRIAQLDRQITDNQQHLEEARWKLSEATRIERINSAGVMVGSVLTVHVREAKNLKPTGVRGKSDPYVVLTCERQKIETKYIPNEVNPVWDEVFTFQIERKDPTLKVVIMDKSTNGADVFQGQVVIVLRNHDDQLKHDNYYELKGKVGDEPAQGKIRLGVQWIWSKVEYFKTIIQQWEDNIEVDRQEMEHLKTQLKKLDQPFGHLMEIHSLNSMKPRSKFVIQLSSLELNFTSGLEGVVANTFGKKVDWGWATMLFGGVFLVLSVLTMYTRASFLDVLFPQVTLSSALLYLWSTDSKDSARYKGLAVGVLLSFFFDVFWWVVAARVRNRQVGLDAEAGLQGLCIFLSLLCFLAKVPVFALALKVAKDVGSRAVTLQ